MSTCDLRRASPLPLRGDASPRAISDGNTVTWLHAAGLTIATPPPCTAATGSSTPTAAGSPAQVVFRGAPYNLRLRPFRLRLEHGWRRVPRRLSFPNQAAAGVAGAADGTVHRDVPFVLIGNRDRAGLQQVKQFDPLGDARDARALQDLPDALDRALLPHGGWRSAPERARHGALPHRLGLNYRTHELPDLLAAVETLWDAHPRDHCSAGRRTDAAAAEPTPLPPRDHPVRGRPALPPWPRRGRDRESPST